MMEPGQIIQWVFIGVILAIVALDKARSAWKRRNGNPGNYGGRIIKLETKMEDMEEDVKQIKRKLNII